MDVETDEFLHLDVVMTEASQLSDGLGQLDLDVDENCMKLMTFY